MTTQHLFRALRVVLIFLAGFTLARAQSTGVIEGRVFNTGTGEYLEKARVSVESTALETLSDELGHYRLVNVPAGAASVRVFFTGLAIDTATVNVAAGQRAEHDFNLAPFDRGAASPVGKLG